MTDFPKNSTVKSAGAERRRDPRLADNVPLKIVNEEGRDFISETVNISRSGAYCRVGQFLEPMTKLKLSMLLPARKESRGKPKNISCGGVVVRTEPVSGQREKFNVAIFFNDITRRDSDAIADYISDFVDESESRQ